MSEEAEILFERRGALEVVTMNRPKALNALTLGMIRDLLPRLGDWADDERVAAVAIRGAGEKAFCAGGDVRAVWEAGRNGGTLTREFFYEEYSLNRAIHRFAKPYIALIDGITMGGGVGLSVHGSYRIAGDRTLLAMPETAIGLFPDVGGSYFLPRLPGMTGRYLALTGARLKAADCCLLGIATHYVPSERQAALLESLAGADLAAGPAAIDAVLAEFAESPGAAPLAEQRAAIDRLFAGETIEEILANLRADSSDWAAKQLAILEQRSPTSLKLTLEQLRRGAALDFEACMTMEFRLSQACMAGPDFYEGIRAVLVDKDHKPVWRPARLDEVTDAMLQERFAPLSAGDLVFEN
jgi:enoyl-CoA hydratase